MKVRRLIELLMDMDEYSEIKIACKGISLSSSTDSGDAVSEMDIASVYSDDTGAVWIDGEP